MAPLPDLSSMHCLSKKQRDEAPEGRKVSHPVQNQHEERTDAQRHSLHKTGTDLPVSSRVTSPSLLRGGESHFT